MDLRTRRADHIEDILATLHNGEWYTWADHLDKVYANLVILNSDYEKPTEKSLTDALAELIAAYPLQELRDKRNQLLAETDWTGLSDLALTNEKSAEWKLYRQKLRNLPDGLDTVEKVKAVTWPTKPD